MNDRFSKFKNLDEIIADEQEFTIKLASTDIEYLRTCKRAYPWETGEDLAAWAVKCWIAQRKHYEKQQLLKEESNGNTS